jgi:RimJ/RimL family protein N-acetyltransferase
MLFDSWKDAKLIVGRKVNLVALEREHLRLLHAWANDPELRQIVGPHFPVSFREKEKWFDQIATSESKKVFIVRTKSNASIGYMYLNIDWVNRKAELAVAIGEKRYRGKGYGSDAVRTLVRHGFCELDLNKIYLYVFRFNKPAIQTYEKCGFKAEGVLRRDYLIRGKYHDRVVMSLLRKDFKLDKTPAQ